MSRKSAKNPPAHETVSPQPESPEIQAAAFVPGDAADEMGKTDSVGDFPGEANGPSGLERTGDGNVVAFPEPMTEQVVNLTADANGPKMRLLRSHRYRQVRIQADEKPDAEHLAAFREAGFRWRSDEKAWTKQLERDAEWRTALDAERLFYAVANAIRSGNGLEPVRELGR